LIQFIQGTKAKTSSSEDSPPAQHSPPSTVSTGSSQATSAGRAALRGMPHQPCTSYRTEVLPPMERLQLQDPGETAKPAATEEKREIRIESVLYTRPEPLSGEKTGNSGTPVKILCNYFEVINRPDWVLYQYHVDFAPVIDSKCKYKYQKFIFSKLN